MGDRTRLRAGQAAAVAMVVVLAACDGVPATDAPWLTAPTRVNHVTRFPLIGTSHSAVDCNQCHVATDTFRVVDCLTCHARAATDAIHVGAVVEYQYATTSCVPCHKDGAISPVDHSAHFPIGPGTSHALACSACHADPTARKDPATLRCAECHGARAGFSTVHAGVKAFAATSAACIRCHAELPVPRVAAHQARFPIAFPPPAGSATHETACLDCHQALRADKPFAADFGAVTCVACHAQAATAPLHAAVADFRWDSPSCFQCHPSGTAASVEHEARFPIAAGTRHAGVTCAECHLDATRRGDVTTLACASCHVRLDASLAARHTATTLAVVVRDYVATPAGCVRCHAEGQVDRGAAHPRGDDTPSGESDHRTAGCTRCHSGFRSAKPWAASWASTPGCSSCHRNGIPD